MNHDFMNSTYLCCQDICPAGAPAAHRNNADPSLLDGDVSQIDGNRSMEAVFSDISQSIDAVAAGKDPLEVSDSVVAG